MSEAGCTDAVYATEDVASASQEALWQRHLAEANRWQIVPLVIIFDLCCCLRGYSRRWS